MEYEYTRHGGTAAQESAGAEHLPDEHGDANASQRYHIYRRCVEASITRAI